jgi:hypothetical protein
MVFTVASPIVTFFMFSISFFLWELKLGNGCNKMCFYKGFYHIMLTVLDPSLFLSL